MHAAVSNTVAAALMLTVSAALATVGAGVSGEGVAGASPSASATRSAATATAGPHGLHVQANGSLPVPPWWKGACDGSSSGNYPGSHPLGAQWDGLEACGPGPNEGGSDHLINFFAGAWGEFEWECVELAMRWMYLAWDVPPYGANGGTVADNYAASNPNGPKLQLVQNGTDGIAPQPGDVLELEDGGDGHTEVVTASHVDGQGDGTLQVITENLDSPTDGSYSLTVSHWVVDGGFGQVIDWLHNPGWFLEEPIVSEVSSSGELGMKVDDLRGSFAGELGGVAQALVVGGGGSDPAPVIVVRTTGGAVEARDAVPYAPWRVLATSGASAIAAASGEGLANGQPTIGWLTSDGQFFVQSHGLTSQPTLEADGVTSIAIGSNSPASSPLLGYVARTTSAFVKIGSGGFERVATGVHTLSLAADSHDAGEPLVGYVGVSGRAFERQGIVGHFSEVGPDASGAVRQIAVGAAGYGGMPLVAYVTSSGDAYARFGSGNFLEEATGADQVEVAVGGNIHAFPVFAVQSTNGSWMAKEGSLSSGYASEGTAPELSLSTLVVS